MTKKTEKTIFEHIKIIQDAIDNKRNLVIFVGAGVSANSGVPTWSKLIEIFANKLGIKNFSSQDYLKIAQCYFNTYPKKYFNVLNRELNKNWKRNSITDFLVSECSPKHFITTNYDNLIEEAIKNCKTAKDYSIVCKNEDIPKIKDNAIIKMHGDFQNRNIVLKEDDYHKYPEEFKLIETFVKSVFATSVVVFVGFSADDPNVNQIYQWVKDILKGNQNPAYLIQIDEFKKNEKKKQKIFKKYFENKGIYQINYSQIQEIVENFISIEPLNKNENTSKNKLSPIGQNLYKTLYFIKNYYDKNIANSDKITLLKTLNFVSDNLIGNILFNDPFTRNINGVLTSYGKKSKTLIEEFNTDSGNISNISEIKHFLSFYGYKKLCYKNGNEKLETDVPLENIIKMLPENLIFINEFNYIEAQKTIEKETILDDTTIKDVNIFAKAYTLIKFNKYWDAYNEVLKISKYAKQKDNNFIFILAEYNRKEIGEHLIRYFDWRGYLKNSIGENEFNNLERDIEQINIKYLINNYLSSDEQKLIKNKLDGTSINSYKDKILKRTDDVDKNTNFSSGMELLHNDFYTNFVVNYIFIDDNPAFKNLYYSSIKLMLQDAKNILNRRNEKETIGNAFSFFGKSPEREFSSLDLYLMVEYIKPKDLETLFEMTNFDNLKLREKEEDGRNSKEVFINSYFNLVNSIIELKLVPQLTHMDNKFFNYVYSFFVIFSKINLTQNDFKEIIAKYMELLNQYEKYPEDGDLFKYLTNFIIEEFNNIEKRNSIDVEILEKLLLETFGKTKEYDNYLYSVHLRIDRLVRNLSSIIEELDRDYKVQENEILKNNNPELLENSYVYMYKILAPNLQEEIRSLVTNKLNQNFNIELYYSACLKDIIQPEKSFEISFYNEVENKIKVYETLKKNPNKQEIDGKIYKTIPTHEKDNAESGLNMASDLINYGKIIDINKFKNLKNDIDFIANDYFNFVLDMQKFDYNLFDISFINYLTNNRLEQFKKMIDSDDKIKQKVNEKFKESINIKNDNYHNIKNRLFYILFNEPYNKK